MPFHVYIHEKKTDASGRVNRDNYYFVKLNEDQLRERVIEPWDRGLRITWGGRTADPAGIETILDFETWLARSPCASFLARARTYARGPTRAVRLRSSRTLRGACKMTSCRTSSRHVYKNF
jgi:hypothetical protein